MHNTPSATYVAGAYPPPAGQAANRRYEIGYPGQSTTLTGNTVFDGVYHVRGHLLLTGGTFTLLPGTVFYVDNVRDGQAPSSCQEKLVMNSLGIDGAFIKVGSGATLQLQGATLTASCGMMWGGIELVQNGNFESEDQTVNGQYYDNEISHARIGLLLGSECGGGNKYRVRYTRFENNTYGMAVLGNGGLTPDEGVYRCTFSSDLTQRKSPDQGNYTSIGLMLRGPKHDDITYTNNTFRTLAVGAEVSGSGVTFVNNYVEKCADTGIRIGHPMNTTPIDYLTIKGNTVVLPYASQPTGQVPPTADMLGMELLDLGTLATGVEISGNEVASIGKHGSRQRIGLRAFMRAEEVYTTGNYWGNLDEGIRMMDASGANVRDIYTGDNEFAFSKEGSGVVFDGGWAANFDPTVGCNTFTNVNYGLNVENGAQIGQLGNNWVPCGNYFQSVLVEKVWNNSGMPTALEYYFDGISNGPVTREINPLSNISPYPVNYTPVIQQPNGQPLTHCRGTNGLRRQASQGTGLSASDLDDLKIKLLNNIGTEAELQRLEVQLLRYAETDGGFDDLATFLTQLSLQNAAAFKRISLYLMERFRQQGDEIRAKSTRNALLFYQGPDAEVAYRVQYFDVMGHFRALPAQGLTPADSTTLAKVAGSGTAFGPVACATLHALRPAFTCGGSSVSSQSNQQNRRAQPGIPTATRRTSAQCKVQAYPNPARESLQVATTASNAGAVFDLIEVGSGRVVRTQALSIDGRATVDLHGVAAGVYLGQVRADGRPLGSCKVVVLP